MKKLTLLVATLMIATISFAQQGSMTFAVDNLDLRTPMNTEANLGYFMTDDIMVSLGMSDWDVWLRTRHPALSGTTHR